MKRPTDNPVGHRKVDQAKWVLVLALLWRRAIDDFTFGCGRVPYSVLLSGDFPGLGVAVDYYWRVFHYFTSSLNPG
jgi:hypothetical protein